MSAARALRHHTWVVGSHLTRRPVGSLGAVLVLFAAAITYAEMSLVDDLEAAYMALSLGVSAYLLALYALPGTSRDSVQKSAPLQALPMTIGSRVVAETAGLILGWIAWLVVLYVLFAALVFLGDGIFAQGATKAIDLGVGNLVRALVTLAPVIALARLGAMHEKASPGLILVTPFLVMGIDAAWAVHPALGAVTAVALFLVAIRTVSPLLRVLRMVGEWTHPGIPISPGNRPWHTRLGPALRTVRQVLPPALAVVVLMPFVLPRLEDRLPVVLSFVLKSEFLIPGVAVLAAIPLFVAPLGLDGRTTALSRGGGAWGSGFREAWSILPVMGHDVRRAALRRIAVTVGVLSVLGLGLVLAGLWPPVMALVFAVGAAVLGPMPSQFLLGDRSSQRLAAGALIGGQLGSYLFLVVARGSTPTVAFGLMVTIFALPLALSTAASWRMLRPFPDECGV